METNLKFNSSVCTSCEQSERLLALGLKKETADCVMMYYDGWHIGEAEHFDFDKDPVEPAWSLHRLMCLCPTEINGYDFYVSHDYVHYHDMLTGYDDELVGFFKDNPFDSLIDSIEWLIKEGYFNKEYLEEK